MEDGSTELANVDEHAAELNDAVDVVVGDVVVRNGKDWVEEHAVTVE